MICNVVGPQREWKNLAPTDVKHEVTPSHGELACAGSTQPPPFRRRSRYVNYSVKNYVSAVRITLLTWKIPLRRSVAFLLFCHIGIGGQPISVLVSSCKAYRPTDRDISSISVLTRNGNGSYGTEERRHGTTERHNGSSGRTEQRNSNVRQNGNGMVETRH